jgi:uncharacterized protein YceH (UPF0502 family)
MTPRTLRASRDILAAMHVADLTPPEQRVLGCLIEKRWTTPDQYPLSLNALRLACNQSTNRDPVTDYDEGTVRAAAERLSRYGLTRLASGHGSRAVKYRHLAEEALSLGREELAALAVLLLRGPQTPGELRGRAERMHRFEELSDVQSTLQRLMQREPPLVKVLPRQPGTKEARYAHLFSDEPAEVVVYTEATESARRGPGLGQLEAEIAALREEVAELRGQVERVLRLVE